MPDGTERRQIASSAAIKKLLARCYRFDANADRLARRKARVGRNANLLAIHHLKEALAAMLDCERDCQLCRVLEHEHAEAGAWDRHLAGSGI